MFIIGHLRMPREGREKEGQCMHWKWDDVQAMWEHSIHDWSRKRSLMPLPSVSRPLSLSLSYPKQNVPSIVGSKTARDKARELEKSAKVAKSFIVLSMGGDLVDEVNFASITCGCVWLGAGSVREC